MIKLRYQKLPDEVRAFLALDHILSSGYEILDDAYLRALLKRDVPDLADLAMTIYKKSKTNAPSIRTSSQHLVSISN